VSKRSVERRLRAKRERERRQRKRDRRMRLIRIWGTVIILVGGGLGLFFAFKPSGKSAGALGTPTPTPSASGQRCPNQLVPIYKGKTYASFPKAVIDPKKKYEVEMQTSCGIIKMTLDPKLAQKAVNNFVFLAREGFYDSTKIHRVVNMPGAEAIMQGGDPKGDGTGDPGYHFQIEKPAAGTTYLRGTVAMANSGGTDTNGSQFFIVVRDWPQLQPDFTIFGKVTDEESLATLDRMVQVPGTPLPGGLGTGPLPNIFILKVTVTEAPA
jgi:cyclophilin family peptidyl-prolyl cis-trans isomerase